MGRKGQANGRNSYDCGGWIPDFQHRHLPELFSEKEIVLREKLFGQLANSAPIIIFSSQICLDDFKRFYPDSTAETSVLHFVSYMQPSWFLPDPRITQKKYDLPERFFLVSNQFWKHKNYDLLIDALYTLKQDDQPIPIIVCTGKTFDYRHPHYSDEIKTKIEHYGLTQNIIMLGLIPRIDQIQLMRQSLAVIQPSLSEGWSTVVEDARSFGKSIYLSDLPVHLEQNPDYAKYFSPLDKVTLAKMLKDGNDTLLVGPDLDRERVAKIMMEKRLNQFGSNFWKITQRRISG